MTCNLAVASWLNLRTLWFPREIEDNDFLCGYVILLIFMLLEKNHCIYLSSICTVYTRHQLVLIISLPYMLLYQLNGVMRPPN
jgi:hypothetical protein